MMFQITQRRGKQTISTQTVDDETAAHAIENWSSRFTDKPRTNYGMKLTLRYVRDLVMNETGKFDQPLSGAMREQFIIQRVA